MSQIKTLSPTIPRTEIPLAEMKLEKTPNADNPEDGQAPTSHGDDEMPRLYVRPGGQPFYKTKFLPKPQDMPNNIIPQQTRPAAEQAPERPTEPTPAKPEKPTEPTPKKPTPELSEKYSKLLSDTSKAMKESSEPLKKRLEQIKSEEKKNPPSKEETAEKNQMISDYMHSSERASISAEIRGQEGYVSMKDPIVPDEAKIEGKNRGAVSGKFFAMPGKDISTDDMTRIYLKTAQTEGGAPTTFALSPTELGKAIAEVTGGDAKEIAKFLDTHSTKTDGKITLKDVWSIPFKSINETAKARKFEIEENRRLKIADIDSGRG